jgi:hypothetical protein
MNDFFADFNVTLPGTRPTSNKPELRVLSTFNRMELTNAACELMHVKAKDRVLIIDNPNQVEDVDDIYYIISHPETGSELSVSGSKLAFSYSGYYSAMILGNPAIHKAGYEDLKDAELLVPNAATKSSIYNVTYTVEKTGETFVYEGAECDVFKLTKRAQHDVKRRGTSSTVTSDEPQLDANVED